MEEEYWTRRVLTKDGVKSLKVKKAVAIKEIDELLKGDKEFLEIMAKF